MLSGIDWNKVCEEVGMKLSSKTLISTEGEVQTWPCWNIFFSLIFTAETRD